MLVWPRLIACCLVPSPTTSQSADYVMLTPIVSRLLLLKVAIFLAHISLLGTHFYKLIISTNALSGCGCYTFY